MKEQATKIKAKILDKMSTSKVPVVSHPKVVTAADYVMSPSFIRYLVIGFASFGMDYGIYYILNGFTPIKLLTANLLSTLITWMFNFYMMNRWTFKAGSKSKAKKLKRYLILSVFNYLFNNGMFQLLAIHWGIHALPTKVVITAMIVCWNYFLYKIWVFKKD